MLLLGSIVLPSQMGKHIGQSITFPAGARFSAATQALPTFGKMEMPDSQPLI